jgi:hypothetical protein
VLLPISKIKEVDRIEKFEDRMHEAARLYANHGIPVVPLRPNTKILPEKSTGINYFSNSTNVKTMDNWFGPKGRYRGWNIGIACGVEIFVADLDLHGRENGIENWEKFRDGRDLDCPIQLTPTGGQHLIMRWRENLTSSSGKLARGVDTRGGDGSPRSHVVAWPSVTKDGSYSWIKGGDIPEAPDWIADAMGVSWAQKEGRGNEEVGDTDEERKYSVSQISAMLDHTDPDILSYEQWLFVGQAINSQHPNEEGLQLWNAWSANGERHVSGECEKRWPGFNPSGTIRIGSLIYFAKEGGYSTLSDPARAGDFAELVARMNEDNAILLTGGKVRIAHRDSRGGIHIMGTQDFNTLMYNRKITIPTVTAKGNPGAPRTITEADVWMAAEERRECIMGMGFFPDEPLWHDGYINLWQGWGAEPVQGNWQMFDSHVKNVLCGGDEEVYNFVLDWVADILQDPMIPKGTAIVMHGKEGVGKGTFCEVVGHLVGRKHYKHVTNERHLTGNFNYLLMDGLLIFADEVIYGGSRSTVGVLKSMVTEKMLVCERKGVDPFMYDNRARLVVASNEDWFIPAGPESRRWLVLEVNDSHVNDRHYFNLIHDQMENGGYEAMMYDLLERKITSNLSKAIETEGLLAQRAIYRATGDSVDIWFDECVGKCNLGALDGEDDWPDDCDRQGLFEVYQTWLHSHNGMRSKGVAHFYKKVEGYGFIKHRPTAKGGIRKWRYKIPHYDQFTTEG